MWHDLDASDLRRDLLAEMKRIAAQLEIEVDAE
jgi:hypothetical protein